MAKYRIEIDRDACVGDKQCWDLAPETFEIDDEDKVVIKDPAGNWPQYILEAARKCCTGAITLYDVETGEKVWPKD